VYFQRYARGQTNIHTCTNTHRHSHHNTPLPRRAQSIKGRNCIKATSDALLIQVNKFICKIHTTEWTNTKLGKMRVSNWISSSIRSQSYFNDKDNLQSMQPYLPQHLVIHLSSFTFNNKICITNNFEQMKI